MKAAAKEKRTSRAKAVSGGEPLSSTVNPLAPLHQTHENAPTTTDPPTTTSNYSHGTRCALPVGPRNCQPPRAQPSEEKHQHHHSPSL